MLFRSIEGHAHALLVVKNEPLELVVPSSPPNLSYPEEAEPGEIQEACYPLPSLWTADGKPMELTNLDGPLETVHEVDETESRQESDSDQIDEEDERLLEGLHGNLDFLSSVDGKDPEQTVATFKGLVEIGMLQITLDIGKARDEGRKYGSKYWMKKIACELRERQQPLGLSTQRVSELFENDATATHPELPTIRVTPAPIDPPPSPTNWYPDAKVPPYVPNSPVDIEDSPYVPKSPEPDELLEVQLRVSMLEDRIDAINTELRQKVRELEAQIFADGCEVTNLKWEQSELRKKETRTRTESRRNNRRNNRSNKENSPDYFPHRYPTRARSNNSDTTMVETKKEIGRMSDKIRGVERRVEDARREITDLRDKIDKALALAPKIDSLAENLDRLKAIQLDAHLQIYDELTGLKNTLRTGIDPQFKQQALDITALKQAYNHLYTVAANLYAAQHPQTSYSIYPTPASTPDRKLVSAF